MSSSDQERQRSHPSGYGCFFKSLGLLLVSAIVCCGGLGGCLLVRQQEARRQLAMTVAQVRASGEPLDGAELNAWYVVPSGENDLTPLYLRALAPFTEGPAGQQFSRDAGSLPIVGTGGVAIPVPGQSWPERPAAEELLGKYQEAIDLLHEAGKQRGSVRYPTDFTKGYGTLLPYAQAVRNAARLLALERHVRLHQGDGPAAAESLLAHLRLGETLKDEPMIISQLVRLAVFSTFADGLQQYIKHGQGTEAELAMLQQAVAEVDVARSHTRALLGERAIAYQTVATSDVKAMQELNGGNAAGFTPTAVDWLPEGQTMADMRPGDTAMILITLTEMIEVSRHPFPKAADEQAAADKRLQQFFANDQKQLPWDRHVLTQLMLPALNATFKATADRLALQRSALAAIAVARFRLRNEGRFPETLDELVPDLLDAVPVDPCDGQPLRYQVSEQGGVIYSVGSDKKDDQGNVGGSDVGLWVEKREESNVE